eukprot:scaffold146_cov265-Pinguiococcus_pyrenoidosus.AAC.21
MVVDHDVCWLQIALNHGPPPVKILHAPGDVAGESMQQHEVDGEAVVHQIMQVNRQILHHQAACLRFDAGAKEHHNVRMVQR